jgi:hypothetical protein
LVYAVYSPERFHTASASCVRSTLSPTEI